jgi:protein-disulfide isomerase
MSMTGWGTLLAVPVSPDRDHILGPVNALVSLVEYSDFECPFCGAAYPVLEEVRAAMGPELQFVYRHFPLTTVHPNALPAAEAAEAAGSQGQFWPMHDSLFEDQAHLAVPDLLARAVALGLDLERFEAELINHIHAGRVQADFLSGVHSGVQGTPSLFVNGVRYDGPRDVASLIGALRLALAR